jgi:polyadenylate-binding protein
MSKNNFSAEEFMSMTPEEQTQELGILLYPELCKKYPRNIAQEITRMLMEMEPMEIMNLLENPDAFEERTSEAFSVLSRRR